jgi:hypothetical protein
LSAIENGTGRPTREGTYAAEVYFGWKILDWKDGAWWHSSLTGRWMANDPVQWVGPFPDRLPKNKTEYDL